MPIEQVEKSIRTQDSLWNLKAYAENLRVFGDFMVVRLKSKDSTIRDLKAVDSSHSAIVSALTEDRDNVIKQRDLEKLNKQYWQDLFKKQRLKTVLTGIAGVAGIIATILILK